AVELWKRDPAQLSEPARQFVSASAKEEQKAERARFAVFTLVAALIVASALFYAKVSHDSAQEARDHATALGAALADVKTLKQQADENAGEAAASALLLRDLREKTAAERAAYGANVDQAMKKVASAKSLDSAQQASADLKAQSAPVQNQVVPLLGLASLAGPSIPKSNEPGPSVGAGTFDQAAIERVVNSRKAGVKRTCLERSSSAASTTKVNAAITIAPNGSVQNVTTTGDDPVVAKCIEQQLRGWSFPAPGEVSTVQIPFVFVRQ
ncbi:MAG: AgmX/PglI C-terminal domain-containing protein, partial [Polyangiaceae bacterium]